MSLGIGDMVKKRWFIIAGVVTATVAFFIPEQKGGMWTSVISAMIVVGIFYLGLLIYILKNGKSTKDKLIGIGVISLLISLIIFNGILQYRGSTFQHQTLTKIRASIDKGIISSYAQQPFLKTLQAYHMGSTKQDSTLEDIFKRRYGDNLHSGSDLTRFVPDAQKDNSNESPFIYFNNPKNANKLELIGQSLLVKGRDSTFNNHNGQKGLLQYRAILTKDGVEYVREN